MQVVKRREDAMRDGMITTIRRVMSSATAGGGGGGKDVFIMAT